MSSRAAQIQMMLGAGIPYAEAVKLAEGAEARGASREALIKAQARAAAMDAVKKEEDKRRKANAKDEAERLRALTYQKDYQDALRQGLPDSAAHTLASKTSTERAKAVERQLSVPKDQQDFSQAANDVRRPIGSGVADSAAWLPTGSAGGQGALKAGAGVTTQGSMGATAPANSMWNQAQGAIRQGAATSPYVSPTRTTPADLRARAQGAAKAGNIPAAAKALATSFTTETPRYNPPNPGYEDTPGGYRRFEQYPSSPALDQGIDIGGVGAAMRDMGQVPSYSPYITNANPDLSYIDPANFQSIIDTVSDPGFTPTGPAYAQHSQSTQTPQYAAAIAARNIMNPNNVGQNTEGNLEFLRRLMQERMAAGEYIPAGSRPL